MKSATNLIFYKILIVGSWLKERKFVNLHVRNKCINIKYV